VTSSNRSGSSSGRLSSRARPTSGGFLVDATKAAEGRITALSDLVGKQHRELRTQLLEQTRTITDDVQRRHADLLALVTHDAAELRDGKADRTALSALFMEVALRLRDESVVPAESGEPGQE
jgi:hypothetical protein